jgi:hypothetical protein
MKDREGVHAQETMEIIAQGRTNFILTPEMLFLHEDTMKNPLEYIDTLDLAFPKIPTKALYKLQVSVAQEIHSRIRYDMTNIQITQEENTILKEVIIQEGQEKNMAQKKVDEMENQIHVVFKAIIDSVESEGASSEEKMRNIVHTLQQYKDQIKELEDLTIPTTPPYVRSKREKDVTTFAENITHNIHKMTDMLEKSA